MEDVKLLAENISEMKAFLVKGLEFGIEKCAVLEMLNVKQESTEESQLSNWNNNKGSECHRKESITWNNGIRSNKVRGNFKKWKSLSIAHE